jgi:hypothetical protein
MTIIDDMIIRNRKFREARRKKIEKMKSVGAPAVLIEEEEKIAKMTLAEYEWYNKMQMALDSRVFAEYAEHNPLKEEVVNEIYKRIDRLSYDYFQYEITSHLLDAINWYEFVSKDDLYYRLYDAFIDHARNLYREKYKTEHENKINSELDK